MAAMAAGTGAGCCRKTPADGAGIELLREALELIGQAAASRAAAE
jgi:fructose-1,6-bisphosphatase/sedoheptulose 1,7-bisphosphatase-like protein